MDNYFDYTSGCIIIMEGRTIIRFLKAFKTMKPFDESEIYPEIKRRRSLGDRIYIGFFIFVGVFLGIHIILWITNI